MVINGYFLCEYWCEYKNSFNCDVCAGYSLGDFTGLKYFKIDAFLRFSLNIGVITKIRIF